MFTTSPRQFRISGGVSLALSATLLLATAGCKSSGSGSGAENVQLNGAGSTFVYPVMSQWTHDFSGSHSNVQINYQSIGSGGGVQQVKNGTVDFGASDNPLSDDQLNGMKPMLQIPESAGPVCLTYSLPGLAKPVQLSADAIAGIFLGKITSWRDPVIVQDNPGVQLPNTKVVVAHRTDGSGTTNAFTTYLSAVSPEWQTKVGKGNAVSWPVGIGGKGSEGVTEQVRQSPGAIGYVELTFAQQNKLPVAAVKNLAGKYVLPNTTSTTAAIAAFSDELSKDPRPPHRQPARQRRGRLPHLHPYLPHHSQGRPRQRQANRPQELRPIHHHRWSECRRQAQLRPPPGRRQKLRQADPRHNDRSRPAHPVASSRFPPPKATVSNAVAFPPPVQPAKPVNSFADPSPALPQHRHRPRLLTPASSCIVKEPFEHRRRIVRARPGPMAALGTTPDRAPANITFSSSQARPLLSPPATLFSRRKGKQLEHSFDSYG